jgi:3-oxoacyl-[acyl-carrier-protein] synthase II
MPVITGLGLVSVLGANAGQTWHAIMAGRSIADHARVPGFSGPDRAVPLAIAAATEAVQHANWTSDICGRDDCALILGTSKGTIEAWMISGPGAMGLSRIDSELAAALKFGRGARMTASAACASGLHALIRAAMALLSGEARRVLVVAVEASVHPLFVSSFQRLGVLAPEGHGCRPFDQRRNGFILSEAAAAVCLESSHHPIGRPIVHVDRFALGSDGTHLIAGDCDGKTLRRLLARVAAGQKIDLIHAHATGTMGDPMELSAIESIVGDSQPILYSHKAALGHSLGAAGLVSVVLNCLCHAHSQTPPNVRSTHPLPMRGLRFSSDPITHPIARSLAIAAGFGGPLAAVGLTSAIHERPIFD